MLKCLIFFFSLSIHLFSQTTYYISNSQGNDSNNGTSQSSPWKSFTNINNTNLNPGDQVLFRKGDTWTNQELLIDRSGNSSNPITFSSYGSGSRPILIGGVTQSKIFEFVQGVHHIVIKGMEFKDIFVETSSGYFGMLFLNQLVNNITIDDSKFSQNMRNVNQNAGMIYMRDANHISIKNSEFTGGIAGITIYPNWNDSHNDVHNIIIDNNWFHNINTRSNPNDGTLGGGRSHAVWIQNWFNSLNGDSPSAYGIAGFPGNTLGQEGVLRDFWFINNRVDSLAFTGIYSYRDFDFVDAEVWDYNIFIQNNNFNLCEGAAVELRPLSNRWGRNHPETGDPIEWSIISDNIIDSIGYNYITKGKTLSNLVNGIESHGWKQVYVQNNTLTYIATRPNNEDGHGFNFDYSANTDNGVLDSKIVCDSVVVRRNIFAYAVANGGTNSLGGNVGAGIQLYYTGVDNEIYDNICYGNGYGISIINPSASTFGNRVYNNTFYGNDVGIKTASSQTYVLQTHIRNNIVASSRIKGWWNSLSVNILPTLIGHNLWWNNNANFLNIIQGLNDILGNPLFADTLNKDFRILDNSGEGIDEAFNVTLLLPFPHQRNSDHTGSFVPVNNLPDIGAHEYGSTGGSNSINLNIKILLEGSFNDGSMTTTLLNNGHLPLTQPYNQNPWNYNGTESVSSIPSNVVDWILVELRTDITSST
ncbi:MAG TPA: hypothetical protein VLN45_12195, partial [Ignavibacteriaceae bacterium]|nr:hypothetical protein [Ignavibacteriaceae bacterium]